MYFEPNFNSLFNMTPPRYFFKCYSFFSIFLIVNIRSNEVKEIDFNDNEYVGKVCSKLRKEPPKTIHQCRDLRVALGKRYGEAFINKFESQVHSETPDSEKYWKFFFETLAEKAIAVEFLLDRTNLKKLPTDIDEWEIVIKFINPLLENIYHYELKYKILALLKNDFNSKSEYQKAFIKLSQFYKRIPPNIYTAIKSYFGYSEQPTDPKALDVIKLIAKQYMMMKELAAIADTIATARSFIEECENRVYRLNIYSPIDCRDIVIKLLILERYYGIHLLEKLEQPRLGHLRHLPIEEFLNLYKLTTKYEFTWEVTISSSKSNSHSSISSVNPLTLVFSNLAKKYEEENSDMPIKKHLHVYKLSSHYIKCRMMLLTEKPDFFSNIKNSLNGTTHNAICTAWDELYGKLSTFIHEPMERLEVQLTDSDKIAAIKQLRLKSDTGNLLIAIIKTETLEELKTL